MFTIERYGNGFLLKAIPSVTQGGTRAQDIGEVKIAVEHYYENAHGQIPRPTICPLCREITQRKKHRKEPTP